MSQDRAFDAKKGENALKNLMEQLRALKKQDFETINLDLRTAALVVLDVADTLNDPEIREYFTMLPEKVFNFDNVEKLTDLGWAAWHVRVNQLAATSDTSTIVIPVNLIDRVLEIKTRMFTCCEYYIGDQPSVAAELASIKSGSGYLDMATDLSRLAKLYQAHKQEIQQDTKYYDEADVDAAKTVSAEIMELIGKGSKKDEIDWSEMQSRVWTLLKRTYDEVQQTGQYLFRNDSRRELFPSLFVATRSRRKSSQKTETPTESTPESSESSDTKDQQTEG